MRFAWSSAGITRFVVLAVTLLAGTPTWAQTVDVPTFEVYNDAGSWYDFAPGPDGNLLFVWADTNGSSAEGQWRAYSKQYSLQGVPLAGPTRIDVHGRLSRPAVAPTQTGYAAVFHYQPANDQRQVHARQLSANGGGIGVFQQIDDGVLSCLFPSVANVGGGLAFGWSQWTINARLTSFFLEPFAPPFQVSDGQVSSWVGQVAPLPGGGFTVVWRDAFESAVFGRSFASNGSPLGPVFLVATGMVSERIATSAAGEVAVVGVIDGEATWVYRYGATGTPIGAPILVVDQPAGSSVSIDIAYDPSGNIYLVWAETQLTSIQARLIDGATGVPGTPAPVGQGGFYVRTRALPDGRFANAWMAYIGSDTLRANVVSACPDPPPTCGDGTIDPPCEVCDDGPANNDTTPNACRTNCRAAGCGDGTIDSGEECDDGNLVAADGCDVSCLVEQCGNGRVEANEQCDDANAVDGDGCDTNCTASACGNSIQAGAEECDDGNLVNGDGCDQSCFVEVCGNDRLEGNEQCDDGNLVNGDGCDADCSVTRCGNGILTASEECDDGNNVSGDGCDNVCLIEECGNGRREANEGCDDGNLVDGDGCEADCTPTERIDAAVSTVRPVTLRLSAAGSASRAVSVSVRNAGTAGLQVLRLTALDDTCPAGTVSGQPDFSTAIAGVQDSVALEPGRRATARLTISVTRASLGGLNAAAPRRCQVRVVVGPATPGTVDESPENNQSAVVVDVFDPDATDASPEIHLLNRRPLPLRIPRGALAAERSLRFRVRSTDPSAVVSFAVADGDCPVGTAALTAAGDRSATVLVRAARAFFTTPGQLSPNRCTILVSAASLDDVDAGNNATPVTLDVVDLNDL